MQVSEDKLQCGQLHQVTQAADLSSLPNNAVVLQSHPAGKQPETAFFNLDLPDRKQAYTAVGAGFGSSLLQAGHCESGDESCGVSGTHCFKTKGSLQRHLQYLHA